MFDIGWTELLLIAVVAVIVVGPKDLPGMLRSLGRYAGKLKRTAGEFRSQFDDALRESELDELRTSMRDMNPMDDIRDGVNESLDPLKTTADGIKKDVESSTPRSGAGRMNTDPPAAKAGSAEGAAASGKTGAAKAAGKTASAPKSSRAKKPSGTKKPPAKKPAARKKTASRRQTARTEG